VGLGAFFTRGGMLNKHIFHVWAVFPLVQEALCFTMVNH
jgi:hypothetical protein